MQLIVMSPTQKNVYPINWVEINTPVGSFVIQPEHAPTLLSLQKNSVALFQTTDGKEHEILVSGGMVEIQRNQTLMLLDT